MKAVILAGGYGTRLYPLSTVEKPKQFINLIGEKTLFQQTVDRLKFLAPEDIFVATNLDYVHFIKEQAPEIPPENIFIEPAMRNTATCIGFAAMQLSKRAELTERAEAAKSSQATQSSQPSDEVMCVVYADHLVRDTEEFAQKLRVAEKLALEENTLNIIEVEAVSPNTKYGYVKIGKPLRKIDGIDIYEFLKFKEKPDLETAQNYIKDGSYLWNTGFYVWRISKILEEYANHAPETHARLLNMHDDPSSVEVEYPLCENISIDYAVMEKVDPKEVRIIKAKLGWNDIGNFDSLFEELEKSGEHEKMQKFKEFIRS